MEMLLILLLYVLQFVAMVTSDCATAPSISGAFHNGSATEPPYSEGVVLRYRCKKTYDRSPGGSNYYQCSNGVWTGGNLKCTLRSCTDLEPPPNSYIVGQAGYYVGETTTFSCQEGFEMNGGDMIRCMADRTWSPQPPTCVKVTCPEFRTPDAQIFQDFAGVRNEFGSKNKITCQDGTVLQGPQYITCLANKTWSGSPSCTIPNCGNPPASFERCAEVFYSDDNTNMGSQVEVTCHEHAVAVGESNLLICSASGRWSQEYHCLCGCVGICDGSVNIGPINVTHNTYIDCQCPDGSNYKKKCWNGTLETVSSSSCSAMQPTPTLTVRHFTGTITQPTPPAYSTEAPMLLPIYMIAIIVSCVVSCTIIIITALIFFCCPFCKTRRGKLYAKCTVCFQNEKPKESIPPNIDDMTLRPLVAKE